MDRGKVVVIDDSPLVRRLAELALEEEGYKVYTAEDGEEGLKIAEEVAPAVILVDFIMPKMSGYQFCKMARESELLKDVPIILITGKGEDVGKKFIEKFAVADYFIKPFKSETLVEKVASIVESQQVSTAGSPFATTEMTEGAEEPYRLEAGRFEEPEAASPVMAAEETETEEEPYRLEIRGFEESEISEPVVSEAERTTTDELYRLDIEGPQGTETAEPVRAEQDAPGAEEPYRLDIAGLGEPETAPPVTAGEEPSGTEEPYRFDMLEPRMPETEALLAEEDTAAAGEPYRLDIEDLQEPQSAAPAAEDEGAAVSEELCRPDDEELRGPGAALSAVAAEEPVAAGEAYRLDRGGFEESGFAAPVVAEEEAPAPDESYRLDIAELEEPSVTPPDMAAEERREEIALCPPDFEEAVERVVRRYFSERLPFLVQKGVADMLMLSGITRTSEVPLQGQLTCLGLSDLLRLVAGGKLTGRLFIYTHALSAELYVEGGIIASVSFSGDAAKQQVSPEKSGSEGVEALRENVYTTLSFLFAERYGSFFFEKMPLPHHVLTSPLGIPASSAIVETARKVDAKVLSALFQDQSAFFMRLMTDEAMEELGLSDDEKRIAYLVEGREPLASLIAMSGMEESEVKRIMHVLTRTGAVKEGGVLHGQNSHSR